MNKNLKCALMFIICLFILSSSVYAAEYFLTDARVLSVRYCAKITNLSDKNIKNTRLYIPLIKDNLVNQKVEIKYASPCNYEIVKDENGADTLKYTVENFSPGKSRTFAVNCKVKVYHLIYNIDFKKFEKPENLPRDNRFLKSQEYIEKDAKIIKDTALSVKAEEENSYFTSFKIYDYLRENINFDFHAPQRGASAALKNKLIACSDAALLYTALCRAADVPARYVGGVFLGNVSLKDGKKYTFYDTHAWSEAFLGKSVYIPVDPTQGRFNLTRRFQCFAQQTTDYLTIWKDTPEPVKIKCKNKDDENRLSVEFFVEVKQLIRSNPPENNSLKRYSFEFKKKSKELSSLNNKLGYENLQTQNYKAANYYIQKAIFLDSYNLKAYENIINLYKYLGLPKEALYWTKKAQKKFPKDARFWKEELEIYLTEKDFDKANLKGVDAVTRNNIRGIEEKYLTAGK